MSNDQMYVPTPVVKVELRDYFAGLAMQALISKLEPLTCEEGDDSYLQEVAIGAYEYADVMLLQKDDYLKDYE